MAGKGHDHVKTLANAMAEQLVSRRTFLAGAGAAGVGLAAPGFAGPALAQSIKRGGQLKIAWIDTVDTLDPHFTSSLGAIKIHDNIYSGILKVD
ncbi:MAG TPA: twin-arginine translocation signal domain-containing protein, partial [Hyphomicrobiaceae bacterium]